MTESELVEALAAEAHASWARYVAYLLEHDQVNPDGSVTLSADYVKALRQLIATPYAELSDGTKEFDRREVRRSMPVIREYGEARIHDWAAGVVERVSTRK